MHSPVLVAHSALLDEALGVLRCTACAWIAVGYRENPAREQGVLCSPLGLSSVVDLAVVRTPVSTYTFNSATALWLIELLTLSFVLDGHIAS